MNDKKKIARTRKKSPTAQNLMGNIALGLRRLRKMKGLTQEKMAKMVGYESASVWSAWETAKREISIQNLADIAERLNVDISEIVKGGEFFEESISPAMPLKNTPQFAFPILGRAAADVTGGFFEVEQEQGWYENVRNLALVEVIGNSMAPVAYGGQYAIIDREAEVRTGDLVIAHVFRGSFQGTYFKRLQIDGQMITLSSVNMVDVIRHIVINKDNVRFYKVVGVLFR